MKQLFNKKGLSLILIFAMIMSTLMASGSLASASIIDAADTGIDVALLESLEIVQQENENVGLVGFEGDYALNDDDRLVSVIVLFHDNPASVQVLEAQLVDDLLEESVAEQLVEDAHLQFRGELATLFHVEGAPEARVRPYEIIWEYRIGLNGVNIELPSNRVHELAELDSVRVVYPDVVMEFDPPTIEPVVQNQLNPLTTDPWGMRAGRVAMRANDLHALGYRGEGVLVAVLDTGVYYHHAAFDGAFLTLEEMQARGANITYEDTIDGIFYGRNFFRGGYNRPANDPMELDQIGHRTNHGTHVAGTIVGRATPQMNSSILGVAPEANLIVYRMLSAGPNSAWGVGSSTIAAIERTVHDRADVVNMSFGSTAANTGWATALTSVAINNVMLANPHMVFVASAGNSGPNPYTLTSPTPGSRYIGVANAGLGVSNTAHTFQTNPSLWTLAAGSSRGPVGESFEIKPDIASHGTSVFSALPSWNNHFGAMSGTSMAAPHIAGAAALLAQYGRNHGGEWSADEIKVRLMNNAIPFGSGLGAFDAGVGFANVYAAATTDTVVSVNYDRVVQQAGVAFNNQNFATTRTGSFSFGSVGQLLSTTLDPDINLRTLVASIENNSNEAQTYTIEYSFMRNPGNAAMLTLSRRTVTIAPGEASDFTASMSVAGNVVGANGIAGFYEGRILVRNASNGEIVANLPFALANQQTVNVAANELTFNLGGTVENPVTPASIDGINVNVGTGLAYFIDNHHRGFTYQYGGFPTSGLERVGYTFAGWYLDANFTTPLTSETVMPGANTVLHARWSVDNESSPREALRTVIEEALAVNQSNYTPLSWARMQSMLVMARNIYNNPLATEAQINEAINLLSAGLDALVSR